VEQGVADSLASINGGNDLLFISKTGRDAFDQLLQILDLLLPVVDLRWGISVSVSCCFRYLDDLYAFFDELAAGSYQADSFSHVGDSRYEAVIIRS